MMKENQLPEPPNFLVRWVHRDTCLPTTAYEDNRGYVRGVVGGKSWEFTSQMVIENPEIKYWSIGYLPVNTK